MTQIVYTPKKIWLAEFRKARAAGNRSRAAAVLAEERRKAEVERAAAAKPELRKARAQFQLSKGGERNVPPNPRNATPRKRRWSSDPT